MSLANKVSDYSELKTINVKYSTRDGIQKSGYKSEQILAYQENGILKLKFNDIFTETPFIKLSSFHTRLIDVSKNGAEIGFFDNYGISELNNNFEVFIHSTGDDCALRIIEYLENRTVE